MNTKQQAGFTLVEVITALALSSILLMALLTLQKTIYTQQDLVFDSYISLDSANRAVERMVREVRNSRNGEDGSYTLMQTNDQSLIFFANADTDARIERIRYFLENGSLKRGIIKPSDFPVSYPANQEKITTIAEYVVNGTTPIFYYYNGNWPNDTTHNPLSLASRLTQTRAIGIKLIINSDPKNRKTNYMIKSLAQIRTLKDNL